MTKSGSCKCIEQRNVHPRGYTLFSVLPLDDEGALRIISSNGGFSAMRQNGTSSGAAKERANSFSTHFR